MTVQKNLSLAVDIDGTLLNSNRSISDSTLSYLNNEWPGRIIFVTGRNEVDAKKVTHRFNPNNRELYVIFNDGQDIAEIGKDGEYNPIASFPYISDEFIKNFILWIKEKKTNWVVYHRDEMISIVNDRSLFEFAIVKLLSSKPNHKFIKGGKNQYVIDKPVLKIAINGFRKVSIDKLFSDFKCKFGDTVYAVKNDGMIEIKNNEATKLEAIKFFLRKYALSESECIYFGNGGNDVDCLKYFTNSNAVGNAVEDAKKAAKNVTLTNDEDGVIVALKHYIERKI